jgi:hypothetical protein
MHRGAVATGDPLQQHLVRCVAGGDDPLLTCGIEGNNVLHDGLP